MAIMTVELTTDELDGHILKQLPSDDLSGLPLEELKLGLLENEKVSADEHELVEALSRLISEGRVTMAYEDGIVFRHT